MEVSVLALGSWRTFEQIPRETGLAVMATARELGIDFLDDARYDDRTGEAPLRTGYSEVVFGELLRAADWKRDEIVVSNKLWWEFWPRQSAAQEVDGSLGRMGLDHLDLVYSDHPPEGLELAELVGAVGELIRAGKTLAWGVLNWPAELIVEATRIAHREGMPPPSAAQLPYNLALRSRVEDQATADALVKAGAGVVASAGLAYGALTGKYAAPGASGRIAGELDERRWQRPLRAAEELRGLAERLGAPPAALALAFTLLNPLVVSSLFGATGPEQVAENIRAVELLDRLGEDELIELRAISGDALDGAA